MTAGPSQVEIRSKSGPGVQLGRYWRGRSGWEGPCSSSESLYIKGKMSTRSLSVILQPRFLYACIFDLFYP